MSDQAKFLNLSREGKVAPDDIDDFVDRWHEAQEGQELHDYLGMTMQEYAQWVRRPDALAEIIRARRDAKLAPASRRTAG
jgi:hypothetical protein